MSDHAREHDDEREPSFTFAEGYSVGRYGTEGTDVNTLDTAELKDFCAGILAGIEHRDAIPPGPPRDPEWQVSWIERVQYIAHVRAPDAAEAMRIIQQGEGDYSARVGDTIDADDFEATPVAD